MTTSREAVAQPALLCGPRDSYAAAGDWPEPRRRATPSGPAFTLTSDADKEEERGRRQSTKTAERLGVHFAIHSDAPVTPLGPLFTASLSSIQPQPYSHGSALLGSIQQVAGAAGVALFVALMTATAASLTAQGVVPVEALAAGIRTGFLCGAILSLFAIIASFFVQRPPMPAGFGH